MSNNKKSSYMRFLPATFNETELEEDSFIGRYLKIFEKILSGIDDEYLDKKKGLGEVLDVIPELFHPRFSFLFEKANEDFLPLLGDGELETIDRYFGLKSRNEIVLPDDFLDDFLTWLASWMDLVLRENWDLQKKREIIARIIPIYRMRGTKKGLEEFLRIYLGGNIEIFETPAFQVGSSQVGVNSLIGKGIMPYDFTVIATLPKRYKEQSEYCKMFKNIKDILDLEKPAHTSYNLRVITSALQIGNKSGSIIGGNALIGGKFAEIICFNCLNKGK